MSLKDSVEKVGDRLNIVEKQAENDLNRFNAFIEDEGYATGAWRGTVGDGTSAGAPGVDAAAGSRGDSGKAGVSGKVIAGAGVVAAAAAGVAAATGQKSDEPASATREGVAPRSVPATGTTAADETADRTITKPFDQTNGLVDVEGDPDGTALSDTKSASQRGTRTDDRTGPVPPTGGSLGQH